MYLTGRLQVRAIVLSDSELGITRTADYQKKRSRIYKCAFYVYNTFKSVLPAGNINELKRK
jgi:hypothetical protein